MPKPQFRTMWMFPRNIRFIDPWKLVQISKIFDFCSADVTDQVVQDSLYSQLEDLGVKGRSTDYRVVNQGGMRTYLAQLACLGLFWMDSKLKVFSPTYAGELLINGNEPIKILRCQLLRMQYPSVYGLGNNVRVSPTLKVKPFCFLVKLFRDARIEGYLSSKEIAVAVVYGRNHKQETIELCIEKILKMRNGASLDDVIDSVDDIRTPKRYKEDDPNKDFKLGVEDAYNIANTAKNYMEACQLIVESSDYKGCFELNTDPKVQQEIKPWLAEAEKFESLDETHQEVWQQRYGRYDKTKAIRKSGKSQKTNGFSVLIQNRFISGHTANPFGFDVNNFINNEATLWGKKPSEISLIIDPLKSKVKDIEYDTVSRAAASGGNEATLLEKSITSIFVRLGFDEALHIGQRKAPREGGYPDIRLKMSSMNECGFADTKATMRYAFNLGDTTKLETYYKECWNEFEDKAPSKYFIYIAGGFDRKVSVIENKLSMCSQKYGHPVSAITVKALLDLVHNDNRSSAENLVKAFKMGTLFASAEELINAAV